MLQKLTLYATRFYIFESLENDNLNIWKVKTSVIGSYFCYSRRPAAWQGSKLTHGDFPNILPSSMINSVALATAKLKFWLFTVLCLLQNIRVCS